MDIPAGTSEASKVATSDNTNISHTDIVSASDDNAVLAAAWNTRGLPWAKVLIGPSRCLPSRVCCANITLS